MKIAILIPSLRGGGAERAATHLANWWSRHGHQVVVLIYSDHLEPEYPIASEVKLVSVPKVDAAGLPAALTRVLRVRRALDDVDPDVAVGFMTTANIFLALASIGRRWRTIGSEHASPIWEPQPVVWRWLRGVSYGLLDTVVALTVAASGWFKAHTLARRVRVIPNVTAWPWPASETGIQPTDVVSPSRRLALAAGRLGPEKGFVDLVGAFALVADLHSDWDLVIVGEGGQRKEIEAKIDQLGLRDRVHLPGRMPNMQDWYAAADLFVLSSQHEGFSNVLVEAMAFGLPVVSCDCDDGPREIIDHGVDGWLAAPHDLQALAGALDRLLGDQALRGRLGADAIKVRERYAEAAVLPLWDELLRGVRGRRVGDADATIPAP